MASHPHDPDRLPRPVATLTPATPAYPAEGGTIDVLLELTLDFPEVSVDRKPLDVSLVIDRSGSMGGAPLAGAKRAAAGVVDMLMAGDGVSVVAYDHEVRVVVPPSRVGADRRAILAAIGGITVGGNTALHAGWAEGVTQVLVDPTADTMKRVVLLTDGLANVGIVESSAITHDVRNAALHGATTSTYGLGRHYDELLLRAMADAGNGNYAFIEDDSQIAALLAQEVAGLSALRGTGVRLRAVHAEAAAVGAGFGRDDRGIVLPDLTAGLPLDVLVTLRVARGAPAPTLVLEWDDLLTGARERLEIPIDVEARPTADVARMAVAPRVRDARILLDIAADKERIAYAARRHDDATVTSVIHAVAERIGSLSSGPERDREAMGLSALRHSFAARDHAFAAKSAMQHAEDRKKSRGLHLRESLLATESAWRAKKGQVRGAPAGVTPTHPAQAAPVVYERIVKRGDGADAAIQIAIGDLTGEAVDAIVNSSNRGLFGTTGVDGAIHRRGGRRLTDATRAIGGVDYGEAVFTLGFDLRATYVIHTATTPWDASGRAVATLRRCYEATLSVAERLAVTSLAVPAIGTGAYGYPLDEAAAVAIATIVPWLQGRGRADVVRFVVGDRATAAAYRRHLEGIA